MASNRIHTLADMPDKPRDKLMHRHSSHTIEALERKRVVNVALETISVVKASEDSWAIVMDLMAVSATGCEIAWILEYNVWERDMSLINVAITANTGRIQGKSRIWRDHGAALHVK